jgi:hypothetical protein
MAASRTSPDRSALHAATATEPGAYCADVLAFHELWLAKCAGRTLPARADFDPAEMKNHLPGITLIDVVADARRFVYRLVGTREVAMRDNDPTGKGVAEGYFGTTAEQSLAAYQAVVDKRAPCFERRRFVTPDGRVGNEESVLLPLSSDGVTIDKIIAYSHHFLARD